MKNKFDTKQKLPQSLLMNQKATHTKGPWVTFVQPEGGDILIRSAFNHSGRPDPKGIIVASMAANPPELQYLPNANLVAAAPDLLKELKQLTEWLQEWMVNDCPEDMDDPDLNSALAAIQKATL